VVYDVIIAGAGPAGSVLAYLLTQHGLSVRVIEKARMPRYKTCGGGLTFKAIQNLPFDVSPTYEVKATGGIMAYAGREMVRLELERPIAWLVMRDHFDHYLIQQAVQSGADFSDGLTVKGYETVETGIKVYTTKGSFKSNLLVGADGVNSIISRSAGLLPHRKLGIAIEVELVVPDSVLQEQGAYATFDFGALSYGYGWIFPKSDHLSVGVYHARLGKAANIKQDLQNYIKMNPILNENKPISIRGHHIPQGGQKQRLNNGRVILVGDAANLADSWLGEGLYYAMKSANIAANVIVEYFENGSGDLNKYTDHINTQIVHQLAYAGAIAGLVNRFPHFSTALLQRSDLLQRAVLSVVRGDLNFQQLASTLILGSPRILTQALRQKQLTNA
jgi:geranylgeranyl reductase family protein